MPNIMAGSLGGIQPPLRSGLSVLSVVVNDRCNLRCQHCYLETQQTEPSLTTTEWLAFLQSVFADLRPEVIAFAGKEVFLDDASGGLVFEAVRMRDRIQSAGGQRTRIGVITNGTLTHRFHRSFREAAPDYIDVSIDGLPDVHDAIRGTGAFDQLRPNLQWLADAFPDRLWVTHTLLAANVDSLPEFIDFLSREHHIQHFSVGLYKAMPWTNCALSLRKPDYAKVIARAMERASKLLLPHSVEVVFDLDHEDQYLMTAFLAAGFESNIFGLSSVVHRFANGLVVRLNQTSIPVGLWRAVRVTAEGYWLAAEDLVHAKDYARRAVARIRDCDFNAMRAYETGLRHPRLKELFRDVPDAAASYVRQLISTNAL